MRLLIMILSIATIILYGYAIAGMGGYLMGRGRLDYILIGLIGGTATALSALYLWRKNLHLYFKDE